jgi:hypothetical protein
VTVTGVNVFCAIAEKPTKQNPNIAQVHEAETPFMITSRSNLIMNKRAESASSRQEFTQGRPTSQALRCRPPVVGV